MDVGWSRLSDLNVHEGKLLGCSYNQSCVGVWVVDISVIVTSTILLVAWLLGVVWFSLNLYLRYCLFLLVLFYFLKSFGQRIEPYAPGIVNRFNGYSEAKSGASGNQAILTESTAKTSLGRLSVSQNSESLVKETKSLARLSVSQNSDPVKESTKESKVLACMLLLYILWFLIN